MQSHRVALIGNLGANDVAQAVLLIKQIGTLFLQRQLGHELLVEQLGIAGQHRLCQSDALLLSALGLAQLLVFFLKLVDTAIRRLRLLVVDVLHLELFFRQTFLAKRELFGDLHLGGALRTGALGGNHQQYIPLFDQLAFTHTQLRHGA